MGQLSKQPYPYTTTQDRFLIPAYDTQIIDESCLPASILITYQLAGVSVAVKSITMNGTITTIRIQLL